MPGGLANIKSLRILRAFRPLKSINAVPQIKKLVRTLIKALPELFNVIVFLGFIFIPILGFGSAEYQGPAAA